MKRLISLHKQKRVGRGMARVPGLEDIYSTRKEEGRKKNSPRKITER